VGTSHKKTKEAPCMKGKKINALLVERVDDSVRKCYNVNPIEEDQEILQILVYYSHLL
jgi:hypothetical protein